MKQTLLKRESGKIVCYQDRQTRGPFLTKGRNERQAKLTSIAKSTLKRSRLFKSKNELPWGEPRAEQQ